MRPDDHKKKKNAQYKKKHGISSVSDNKDKPKVSVHVVQKAKLSQKTTSGELTTKPYTKSLKVKEEIDGSDDETEKSFSRRQLVSNWSRYDELSSEESDHDTPIKRGEDFNKLLAQAGGSAAQFRLKDEEDWNVDGEQEGTVDVLALNLSDLSQSINSLPLYLKLGLDTSLFTADQMENISRTCKKNSQHYEQNNIQRPSPKRTEKSSPKNQRSSNKTRTKTKHVEKGTENIEENKTFKKSDNICEQNSQPLNFYSLMTNSDPLKENIPNASIVHTDKPTRRKTKDILELEDDLDALLELEDPMATMTKVPFLEYHRQRAEPSDNLTSCGNDKVNAISAPSPSLGSQQTHITQSGPVKPGCDNLENWLDSMLDD